MRVKKYLALIFAAILATTMLTACPWEKEEDETDDASSVPVTSTDTSQDEDDDDGGGSGGDTGPTLKPTVSTSEGGGTLSTTVTHDTATQTYTVKVTATPHENYYVQSLTVTTDGKTTTWKRSGSQVATFAEMDAGTDITIETTDNETFTVSGIPGSTTDCSISAEFAQYCVVTVNITGNGTVKINNEDIDENSKELKVIAGDTISIEAMTDESKYGLASVMVGDERQEKGEDGTFTVTPTEDTKVNVTFAPIINTIEIYAKYLGTTTWNGCIELQCTSGYTSIIRETGLLNASNDHFSAHTRLTDVSFLQGVDALVTVRLKQPGFGGTTVDTSKKIEEIQIYNNNYQMEDIPVKDNEDHSWTFTIPANQIGNSVWITIADKTAQ